MAGAPSLTRRASFTEISMQFRPETDRTPSAEPLHQQTESSQQNRAAAEDGLPLPQRYIAAAAVLAAIVLAVLDGAIANVALPSISQTLAVSPSASIWVVTSYQLALVVGLLPCAALGESFGFRRVFTTGVIVFTLASALCALSPSLGWLIAARFLQGLGGAAIMSLIAALLRLTYPQRLLGTAIGWNALAVALSSAAGPTIGAAILTVADWPWLFAVNVPVGVLVLIASRFLPTNHGTGRRLDLLSVMLNAGFFAPLVFGAELLSSRPAIGAVLLVAAVMSLVALIRRELHRQAPLIPLDLLRAIPFRISVIASVCCFTAQMVSYVALPFYLQQGLGLPALETGLYMTPWPLAVALAAPISGHLSNRIPTAWLCAAGGVCLAVGLLGCALWPLQDDLTPFIPLSILCGLGFGFFQTPNNRNMLLSAPRARSGAAGGMQSTARLTGQTVGAVIMALLFTQISADIAPRVGLALAAALALAGGIVSTLRLEK
ncbi:MFS transporter [Rhizobium sp. KVB221]|uniref:MFS transporter n=1 Tax=Rhizobium setariae TaxID=2801340 RepID=A0A936YIF9_9HYPH|nr:MFS transporter [Rhizobium setariae]MBL0370859.1 MFS transporter [Rhizobium setariae]